MRRRTLLGALSVSLVAGCGSQSGPDRTTPTRTPEERAEERTEGSARETAATETSSSGPGESVTLVNDAVRDRYVTLVVESGEETVFVESRTVRGGTSVRFADVVRGEGPYRVVVETADGVRGAFDWKPTVSLDTLRVAVTDEVSFAQVVRCEPDCTGVSLGGTSTGYPDGAFDPRGRRVASTLRVNNQQTAAKRIRLRVAEGTVLDYRYRVPPASVLVIPVPQRSGETRVGVNRLDGEDDTATRTYAWEMERSPTLDVDVGAALTFSCGPRTRDLRLRNDDDAAHTLTVEVNSDGDTQFRESFELAADTETLVRTVVATAGTYRVRASTGDSADTAEWSTCPPSGPLSVRVGADGRVVVGGV